MINLQILSPFNIINLIYRCVDALLSVVIVLEILLLIIRKIFRLQYIITIDRIEVVNKVILSAGTLLLLLYILELFELWYCGYAYEQFAFYNRALGAYWYWYVLMLSGKLILPQLYWFKPLRRNLYVTFILSILIILPVGFLMERFIIIVTSWYI